MGGQAMQHRFEHAARARPALTRRRVQRREDVRDARPCVSASVLPGLHPARDVVQRAAQAPAIGLLGQELQAAARWAGRRRA